MAPSRGLRGRLSNYGDSEFSLFLRRAFIKAAGFSDEALDRPIIGIADTSSDFNPCHGNVRQLVEAAKRGIMLAGGLPMTFPTMSIHESFSSPTSMYLRNLMAMETEELVRSQPMDAVLMVGGCDKTLPAQLMAAASSEIPAIFLPTGPMSIGNHKGARLGACTDCRRQWGRFRSGEIDEKEIGDINNKLVPSVGTCSVMGTASTMAILVETMGLCVPGAGSAPATSSERVRLAELSGRVATRLATDGAPLVRDVLTPAVLRNALVVLQAAGGSTNAVVHMAAVCGRLAQRLDLRLLDELGRTVPLLVDLKPSGDHYMEQFHHAGGVPRLLTEIAEFLDLDVPNVNGCSLADSLVDGHDEFEQNIIRPLSSPLKPVGAMAVLRGNLAPRGAIIKQTAASRDLLHHRGRAVVFESIEDMNRRIDAEDLDVAPEDILVLRNAGPRGAPAMPEAGYLPIPRKLARQGVTDMVRISDARMSGTAFGTVILHVTPEAADRGPLAAVRTGDIIELDVESRSLDVLLGADELKRRLNEQPLWQRSENSRGYAWLFDEHVLQADEGLDFDFMRPGDR